MIDHITMVIIGVAVVMAVYAAILARSLEGPRPKSTRNSRRNRA